MIRVCALRVLATACALFGPLQHPIHCREVQLPAPRGAPPPWRAPRTARPLQDAREDLPHLRVVAPLGALGHEDGGPHGIATRWESHVHAARFILRQRRGHPWPGRLRGPLRPVAVRARLAGRLHAGLPDQLQGALDPTVTDRRTPEDAALRPALWRY